MNEEEHCHYSGLPSPKAYEKDLDYDGMGNQGRVPEPKEQYGLDYARIFLYMAIILFTALLIHFIYEYLLFKLGFLCLLIFAQNLLHKGKEDGT